MQMAMDASMVSTGQLQVAPQAVHRAELPWHLLAVHAGQNHPARLNRASQHSGDGFLPLGFFQVACSVEFVSHLGYLFLGLFRA
jgi:hypothetical protein